MHQHFYYRFTEEYLVAVDSDDNGKKEDLEGNELSCS